jgi:hypothetical protein
MSASSVVVSVTSSTPVPVIEALAVDAVSVAEYDASLVGLKVMVTVSVSPAGTEAVDGLIVKPLPESVAETTLEPAFESRKSHELEVPTLTSPKSNDEGVMTTFTPVPVMEYVVPSLAVSEPVNEPVAVGANVTETVVLPPAATETEVGLIEKGDEGPVKVTALEPEFEILTCFEVVVPTLHEPNASEVESKVIAMVRQDLRFRTWTRTR